MCLCICLYVYMVVCMCVYIYAYVQLYRYTYVCIFIVYMYVYMYMYMYVYVCACVLMCACICVYVHFVFIYVFYVIIFFFLPFSTASHGLPLFLDTSNWRRNVWCTQPLTYHITHRHRKMQNHMKTEEVTLELTPPLKCIYTPRSIKVLFPLNQCKSSFRNFMANSIKTYTSQCNKKMIHNLSNHTLTEDEYSVLTKDLSFVPTPTKTFKKETNKCWNKFKTRMLTQYFFFATAFMTRPSPLPFSRRNPIGHLLTLTTSL